MTKLAITNPDQARAMHERVLSMLDPASFKQYMIQQGRGPSTLDSDIKVGAQRFYNNGVIIQSTNKGRRVYNKNGELIKGKAAADAIGEGIESGVKEATDTAGGKKTATLNAELALKAKVEAGVISAKEAAKISTQAYEKLQGIEKNISNLREGVTLLREEGANTGVIDKYLPSFKKATIRLKNLQGRLGLDVLRNTTFGALSASELKFALDTAVPQGLQPKDLAEHFEKQIAAQELLSDYVESAAIYLGTPGNTVSGWLKEKRAERKANEGTPPDKKTNAGGPTLEQFLLKAGPSNPGVPEAELINAYNQKYGG